MLDTHARTHTHTKKNPTKSKKQTDSQTVDWQKNSNINKLT